MNYRPEGWVNPHTPMQNSPFENVLDAHFRQVADGKHTAFEAGADAMLEELKKKDDTVRLEFDGNSVIPAHGDFPEMVIEGKPYDKGWMAFIPEEAG